MPKPWHGLNSRRDEPCKIDGLCLETLLVVDHIIVDGFVDKMREGVVFRVQSALPAGVDGLEIRDQQHLSTQLIKDGSCGLASAEKASGRLPVATPEAGQGRQTAIHCDCYVVMCCVVLCRVSEWFRRRVSQVGGGVRVVEASE